VAGPDLCARLIFTACVRLDILAAIWAELGAVGAWLRLSAAVVTCWDIQSGSVLVALFVPALLTLNLDRWPGLLTTPQSSSHCFLPGAGIAPE